MSIRRGRGSGNEDICLAEKRVEETIPYGAEVPLDCGSATREHEQSTEVADKQGMDPLNDMTTERKGARQRGDPTVEVCMLARVTADGEQEVRAISLREIKARGFELLLQVTSPKWCQLMTNGGVSTHPKTSPNPYGQKTQNCLYGRGFDSTLAPVSA